MTVVAHIKWWTGGIAHKIMPIALAHSFVVLASCPCCCFFFVPSYTV